ncbi:MAG: preprotein translocase subunit YajC [Spirochaetes bacterium]|nr:preprotein translocase subunit YajC [Spirochaetota bacterium]
MFTQVLYAQGAAPAAGGQAGMMGMMQLLLIVGIFVIFYFVLIRPQQKQQKILQQKIAALKKGDKVVTAGGIFGEFVSDKDGGKIAIVKISDEAKIEILKSSISTVLGDDTAKK